MDAPRRGPASKSFSHVSSLLFIPGVYSFEAISPGTFPSSRCSKISGLRR